MNQRIGYKQLENLNKNYVIYILQIYNNYMLNKKNLLWNWRIFQPTSPHAGFLYALPYIIWLFIL